VRNLGREIVVGAAVAVAVGAVSILAPVTGGSTIAVVLETAARTVAVAMPVAAGLYAWRRPPFERFGRLLVATGGGVLVVTLSLSDDAPAYSTGRVATWVAEAALLYLILSFPSGRLPERVDRYLATAAVLLVALLYLPTALVVERYPTPTLWVVCGSDCPGNAFMAAADEPRVVADVVYPVRELLTIALVAVIIGRLAQRLRGASRLRRRTLAPVFAVAIAWAVLLAAALALRRASPGSPLLDVAVWMLALTFPAIALAFLVGVVRWWAYVGASLRRLAARLRSPLAPEDLRLALAEAFDDPALRVFHRLAHRWMDADGRTVPPPVSGAGRSVTEIRNRDAVVAALVHDAALQDEPAFIDAAASYTGLTLEINRLTVNAESLVREAHESRARIAASADEERKRIERDLHDGAQQRLVTLRIRLGLVAEQLGGDATTRGALDELGSEVDAALDDVRSLARGTYPYILTEHGLDSALAVAAEEAPISATVVVQTQHRYPAEVENAVYFCCLEALQNVAKHAGAGAGVRVTVAERDDSLSFDVRDDGAGFDPAATPAGTGLTNIRDRVAAVGGRVAIDSEPGRGAQVSATIPLSPTATATHAP
jgi:signal transduction histidine kinase